MYKAIHSLSLSSICPSLKRFPETAVLSFPSAVVGRWFKRVWGRNLFLGRREERGYVGRGASVDECLTGLSNCCFLYWLWCMVCTGTHTHTHEDARTHICKHSQYLWISHLIQSSVICVIDIIYSKLFFPLARLFWNSFPSNMMMEGVAGEYLRNF